MMASNTVSLYIDDVSVRLMVTRGKRIAKMADVPLEIGLGSIDTEEKEDELAGKIKQLLKSNKVNHKKIILGLSGLHCLTRPLDLPELPKAMLGEAVIREAKRALPVPPEQLYLSWQIISVSGGKTRVFLVALPRQIADTALRVIGKAGCKPYLMDIKPIALARLSGEATAVILDVQPKEFDIIIMINGIPQPVRTIAFPQEALSLQDKFDIVREDLKRTLEFVKSNFEGNQINQDTTLFISGELAEHKELHESLADELGLKTAILTSPIKYLKYLEPSNYLANVGLALKELVKESGPLLPNFNTLPQPYQPAHISMNRLMAVPAALAAFGIIILLATTIQKTAAEIESLQSQLDNKTYLLEKKQAPKQAAADKVAALEQQIAAADAEFSNYTVALTKIADFGNDINLDLAETVGNMVRDLSITSLSVNGAQVSLSGSAGSEEAVFEYVRNLTATGRFKEITINNMSSVLVDEATNEVLVSYSLGCRLEADR